MNTVLTHKRVVQRLVPLWNVMLKATTTTSARCNAISPQIMVKRAGRNLNDNEYIQLGKSAQVGGCEKNVNIQFGFLGGFGGDGIFGESTG